MNNVSTEKMTLEEIQEQTDKIRQERIEIREHTLCAKLARIVIEDHGKSSTDGLINKMHEELKKHKNEQIRINKNTFRSTCEIPG